MFLPPSLHSAGPRVDHLEWCAIARSHVQRATLPTHRHLKARHLRSCQTVTYQKTPSRPCPNLEHGDGLVVRLSSRAAVMMTIRRERIGPRQPPLRQTKNLECVRSRFLKSQVMMMTFAVPGFRCWNAGGAHCHR
jgi:hypothetical protein